MATAKPSLYFENVIQIDDHGPMNTYKARRVELLLERLQGFSDFVVLSASVNQRIVAHRINAFDECDPHKVDTPVFVRRNSLHVSWLSLALPDPGHKAFQRFNR